MRDTAQLNESLKLQLSKSHAQHVTDPSVLTELQNTQQELEEVYRQLELQQCQHEV